MKEFMYRRIIEGEYIFDVRLYPPERPLRPFETPEDYRIWQILHAKRIDAVCETPDTIYIIEVKDILRPSAVGQVLTYMVLFEEQFKPRKKLKPVIVAGEDDPQMHSVCRRYNIDWYVMDIVTRRKRILGI